MIRGTTPTFVLTLDDDTIDLSEMDNVYATITQAAENVSITKTGEDLVIDGNEVDVYLSQAETLKYKTGTVEVQLNWTFENGKRACSQIALIRVGKNLENRVLE